MSLFRSLIKKYKRRQSNAQMQEQNDIQIFGKNVKNVRLYVSGQNNYIKINTNNICLSSKIKIHIYGNDNRIIIGEKFYLSGFLNILIGQDHPNFGECNKCEFVIGENTTIEQMTYTTFNSNAYCHIGKNCMFAYEINLFNTDAHPIFDFHTHRLINYVKGIEVGDHVWVGSHATILKNTQIANDCIIGWGSIVSGRFLDSHCAIAGNPARVVKTDITWDPNGAKYGYIQNKEKQR